MEVLIIIIKKDLEKGKENGRKIISIKKIIVMILMI
jgi:hypothetical protein